MKGSFDLSDEEDDELDASTALKCWKTHGTANDGPKSYKDVLKEKKETEEEFEGEPSPPDIIRKTDEGTPGAPDDEISTNNAEEFAVPPTKSESALDSPNKQEHARSNALPYRAYARRSRLRKSPLSSPPGSNQFLETDISVVSEAGTAHSTSSQTTSLAERANRFVKDKKKEKHNVGGTISEGGSIGRNKPPNSLREMASKDRIKQRTAAAAANNVSAGVGYTGSVVDENQQSKGGGPQTIDLKPALLSHNAISGLVVDPQKYYAMDVPTKGEDHIVPVQRSDARSGGGSTSSMDESTFYSSLGTTSVPVSTDESATHSELKAKDLFSNLSHQNDNMKVQPATPQIKNVKSDNGGFVPIPGIKSFDFDWQEGCQVFEALNASIGTACNTISSSIPKQAMSNAFCNDLMQEQDNPSDEDVAIEVEYVSSNEGQVEGKSVENVEADSSPLRTINQ